MLGYTFWHQLFVYSCISCLLSTHLFMLLLFSYLFIMWYLVIFCLQFILLLFCARCLYARALPFTHIHSLGRFLTTLDLHVQILDALFLLCRCSMWLYAQRRTGRSFFWFCYSFLSLFLLLFLIHVYHTWLLFYSLFHFRSCVAFICIIAVIIDYYGLDL